MSKLEEYISTLSEEEKEQYKDLIEETRKRDRQLQESFDNAKKNMKKLYSCMESLVKASEEVHEKVAETNEKLSEIKDDLEKKKQVDILNSLSDDQFFKA